ncbi:tetratricopeptide repeat protein [Porphyromonas macacae]|nr:tetratricopeptide repeat protein [Porphyromonas macacae]
MKRSSILLLSLTVMLFVLLSTSKCTGKQVKTAEGEASELYSEALHFQKGGDLHNALKYYTLSIEKDSSKSDVFNNRGSVRESLLDSVGALNDYLTAIRLDSNNVVALNNTGMIYIKRHQFKQAEKYLLKSIAADSLYANSYYNLGLIFYEAQQYAKAIKCFLFVEKLERSMNERYKRERIFNYIISDYYTMRAFSYYFLGLCYKRMGNMEKAVDYLRLAEEENVTGAADSLKTITRK